MRLRCRMCGERHSWLDRIKPTYRHAEKRQGRWVVEVKCQCGHAWMTSSPLIVNQTFRIWGEQKAAETLKRAQADRARYK